MIQQQTTSETINYAGKQVLVFDSGVGGLSISEEIIAACAGIKLHYLSDNAAFPYGEKTESFLIERTIQVISQALQKIPAEILVIACNTASTIVLPALREHLAMPVIGVVPAIKTAAALTKTGSFGLLATRGTVARPYTQQLINDYAKNHHVISVGSNKLVQIIEQYIYSGNISTSAIGAVLAKFDQHPYAEKIDTVVLGCTHFPIIRSIFEDLRPEWQWVDSGPAIASRVQAILNPVVNHTDKIAPPFHEAWFTKELIKKKGKGLTTYKEEALQEYLNKKGFTKLQWLDIQ